MYHKLKPLQGSLIPTCHGEARWDGSPALILSVVDGCLPRKQGDMPLSKSEFRRRLEAAYRKLAAFGVSQGDAVLDNFLLVDHGVVVVDLESVFEITPDEAETAVTSHVDHLTKFYAKYLDSEVDDTTRSTEGLPYQALPQGSARISGYPAYTTPESKRRQE